MDQTKYPTKRNYVSQSISPANKPSSSAAFSEGLLGVTVTAPAKSQCERLQTPSIWPPCHHAHRTLLASCPKMLGSGKELLRFRGG